MGRRPPAAAPAARSPPALLATARRSRSPLAASPPCGAWRLLRGAGSAEPPEEAGAPAAGGGFLARGGRFYAMWAVLVAYLALLPVLGFPVATAPALAALFVLLGERRPALVAALSLGATAVLHLGFAKGLGVQLPLGVLAPFVS